MRRLLLLMMWPLHAFAYCPSYTASSASNTHMCAIEAVPGANPTVAEWQPIFDTVGHNMGMGGPAITPIASGCANPVNVPAQFPCELLKAIAMNESGWKQFCVPESPPDQVGK